MTKMERKRNMSTVHPRNRLRITSWKKKNTLRIGTWNIKSLNTRDQELIEELKERNIEICAIQETKKKGKGQIDYGEFILIYSGVEKEKRAVAGVGILVHKKYKDLIEECKYISERIITIKIKSDQHHALTIVSVYSPEDCKLKQEREAFYEILQNTIDAIPSEDDIIMLGDFNARIGQDIIPGVKQRFNEEPTNDNGEMMLNFSAINNLRINNTYFNHKPQYKYTFENSRGHKSMIDYILTNRKIQPYQIVDVRTLNSANIGSDHRLVLGKIRINMKKTKKVIPPNTRVEQYNIESLWNESTKYLYQNRLKGEIEKKPITQEDNVETSWENLRRNIEIAATEALGKRTIRKKKEPNKKPWFRREIKEKCKEKQKAYLRYKSLKTPESYEEYKKIRGETKTLVNRTKEEHWEIFSKRVENDLYGLQKQTWRMIRNQRKDARELIETNYITKETWTKYLKDLFRGNKVSTEIGFTQNIQINEPVIITTEEVEKAVKQLRNRKSPGPDQIVNELLKYGGPMLIEELTKITRKILTEHKIPDEWRLSTTILMFKKGEKQDPSNYRGINLLNTTLKLITKILTNKINTFITLADEQQGFRTGRSCTDAIFIMRQIVEKSVEYNRPAFICFIDLQKAFDRVQLENVIELLYNRGIPQDITETIKNIYAFNTIQARVNTELTEPIPVYSGIRQGDSLSPLLFNIIMDEIITEVRTGKGYEMGEKEIKILCYADDAVLFAETEDNLQKLLSLFNKKAKTLNMIISTEKTKCLTTSKEPLRCKLELENRIIQQVMTFNYLGINIANDGNTENEVKQQVIKANKTAGCLNDTIWRNKYLNVECKSRIYKATVRPILTYTAETRPETEKTKRLLETTEMKILRKITNKTLYDRERSENIRKTCRIEPINEWVQKRRIEWNQHINRMPNDRIVKVARDKSPIGRRSIGRPRKRWSDNLR